MLRILGWALTVVLCGLAVVTLAPAVVGLSTTTPVAQAIALRPLLAVGFGLLGAVLLLVVLVAALTRRRWPRRAVLALVLLGVGGGHAWVLYDRGVEDVALPEARDGAITVLALNSFGGGASIEQVVDVAHEVSADVLALPETSQASAEAIAVALADRTDTAFQVFAQSTGQWDANSTALLVSAELGDYEEAAAPVTWHASVRADPAGGDGPVLLAVHPLSPHEPGAAMDRWAEDLDAVAQVCRTEPGVVVAGDFNATLDHGPLRDLGSCVDAAVEGGVGGVGTWPANLPRLLGAPIDHILADADRYVVDAAAVLEVGASDHRAVVTQLSPAQ